MEKIVVTRHPGLAQYFRELNLTDGNTQVVNYVKVTDIEDKHVLGVLPSFVLQDSRSFVLVLVDYLRDQQGLKVRRNLMTDQN